MGRLLKRVAATSSQAVGLYVERFLKVSPDELVVLRRTTLSLRDVRQRNMWRKITKKVSSLFADFRQSFLVIFIRGEVLPLLTLISDWGSFNALNLFQAVLRLLHGVF